MRDGAIKYSLTSWAASDDKLADFIINKDEEWVGEGAEPPVWSGKEIGPKLKSHLFLERFDIYYISNTFSQ